MSDSNKKEPIIKIKKVIPVLKEAYCPECGEQLKSNNYVYQSNPPLYPYYCPNCDYSVLLHELYPTISYEEVKDESTVMGEN